MTATANNAVIQAVARSGAMQNGVVPNAKVAIIILNWDSYGVTRDCLLSMSKLDYANFEVVLVDNGSADGSPERLAADFPHLRIIRNPVNLGFTGGNNVGLRDALTRSPDYLLLLNNDTIVASNFLTELVRVAESDHQIGLLNPKIYYFEPAKKIWCAGGIDKLWTVFPQPLGRRKLDDGSYDQAREISFTNGCALLVRAEAIRTIGLLDEVFFLSFEDRDWSARALRAGFKAVYVPSAVIWHKESYCTKRHLGLAGRDYFAMRNAVLFARKHLRGGLWPLFVMSVSKYLIYKTGLYLLLADWKRVRALYLGIWSGCFEKQGLPASQTRTRCDQFRL